MQPNDTDAAIITERLRGLPLDEWSESDREEETTAIDRRIAAIAIERKNLRSALAICNPLTVIPEDFAADLGDLLPESWPIPPREFSDPAPWQLRIQEAYARLDPVADIELSAWLASAGIGPDDPEWKEAKIYAREFHNAATEGPWLAIASGILAELDLLDTELKELETNKKAIG